MGWQVEFPSLKGAQVPRGSLLYNVRDLVELAGGLMDADR
jgi:hypothetical protein